MLKQSKRSKAPKKVEGPLVRGFMLFARNGSPLKAIISTVSVPGARLIPDTGRVANSESRACVRAALEEMAARVTEKAQAAGFNIPVVIEPA